MENDTPRTLGYRMPAEWEPHEGTWLIWPHEDTHEDSQLHLEHLWLEMIRVLQNYEMVHIVVPDPDGMIVKEASKDQEQNLICQVDLDLVEETKKASSFPYRDRRVDSYQDLLKLYSD